MSPGSTQGNPEPGTRNPEHSRILLPMNVNPLLRWDGLHLVVDLPILERHLDRALEKTDRIEGLVLEGYEDALRVLATVHWKGLGSRVAIDLAEIRLKQRFLGFRMRRPKVLGGVPVPRRVIEMILRSADIDVLTVFGEGILVLDLRKWLPRELDLRILTIQATERSAHVWFGTGGLQDLPARRRKKLPAGPAATDSGD